MGAQEPYNESQLNSIIISGKIVTKEIKFYQSLQDPIVLVFQRLVSFLNKLFILIFLPDLTIRPRIVVLQMKLLCRHSVEISLFLGDSVGMGKRLFESFHQSS